MNSRNDLAKLFSDRGFKNGAEIGVYKGAFSKVLIDSIPGLQLLCIDPWAKRVHKGVYSEAVKLLSRYPGVRIIREYSVNALKDVPDNSLDFVYIDANHKRHQFFEDLLGWFNKVRSGGIISGHDYQKSLDCDVIDVLREFGVMYKYDINLIPGDAIPSWYFEKR